MKNLRPFNLEEAKAGKTVCTRDGRKVRIICYDYNNHPMYPIIALIKNEFGDDITEEIKTYTREGVFDITEKSKNDLMMIPEKCEGWVNIYKDKGKTRFGTIFESPQQAYNARQVDGYITTTKIEWEE